MKAKYYTSIGMFERKNNLPVVIAGGEDYVLSLSEMVLWSKGLWKIQSYESLKNAFDSENEIHASANFDFILSRLKNRGLIAEAEGASDMQALEQLSGNLSVVPIYKPLASRIEALFLMIFKFKTPLLTALYQAFKRVRLSRLERDVLLYAKNNKVTRLDINNEFKLDNLEGLQVIALLYLKKMITLGGV